MEEKNSRKYPLGMIFGVFDGLHQGHRHFLLEAKKRCQNLIVVVAHPDIVALLKQRLPHHTLEERIHAIQSSFEGRFQVVPGDTKIGTWSAIKKFRPDIIFLGYDQEKLGEELEKLTLLHDFISPHYPEKFKSSLLHKKKNL